jgi:hypothetical protein
MEAEMPSTPAIFLLTATLVGGVAQGEPVSWLPRVNVTAASGAWAPMPSAPIGYTLAQNAGPSPDGQVPEPNATPAGDASKPSADAKQIQPVPGAWPDSDATPSTISEKNARDDQLPVAAYRLKNLTDEQRQSIHRTVKAMMQKDQPLAQSIGSAVDIGTVLPRNLPLRSLPTEVTNQVPQVKELQFGFSGDKLILADPLYHQVLAVIP